MSEPLAIPPRLIGIIRLPMAKVFGSGEGPPKWEEKSIDLAFDTEGRAWYLVARLERLDSSYVRWSYQRWQLAIDLPFDPRPAGASVERPHENVP
jgi:hypothetical protein